MAKKQQEQKAVVLYDFGRGKVGDVIVVSGDDLSQFGEWLDASDAAVKAAEAVK